MTDKIIVFCCNWSAFSGIDTAGKEGCQYPANLRIIKLMCAGRINAGLILKALEYGAESVIVLTCPKSECHYLTGNETALKEVEKTKKLLALLGINTEKVKIAELGANDSAKFIQIVSDLKK